MTAGRIDTHTHVVPPVWDAWLRSRPAYDGPLMSWSYDTALESFAKKGISTGILSVASPGVRLRHEDDVDGARRRAREVNEFCAEIVRKDPDRFGYFATLTLPDVEGAIAEAEFALDQLHADGVVLLTNVDGAYLGDPAFDPLLQFLDERSCVVFVHPRELPGALVPGIREGVVDFLADTTRAAVNMVKNDCLRRFPQARFLLSHAGGSVPYAAARISRMLRHPEGPEAVITELRKFYMDTALTGGAFAPPSLLAFADPTHITFGTDWPYEIYPGISDEFTADLDAFAFSADMRHAINRGNAEKLFPRLAS